MTLARIVDGALYRLVFGIGFAGESSAEANVDYTVRARVGPAFTKTRRRDCAFSVMKCRLK